MIIPINEKYRLTADSRQWKIEYLKSYDHRTGLPNWRPKRYYTTLANAVVGLQAMGLQASSAATLSDALEANKKLLGELVAGLTSDFDPLGEEDEPSKI